MKKKKSGQDIDLFISISGPEPARTKLAQKVLKQIKQQNIQKKYPVIVIAGGNLSGTKIKNLPAGIIFHAFLSPAEQEDHLNRAKTLVIRAGYTTIMELAELEKKALLIPAPGQTEQEYLAKYLCQHKYFYAVKQSLLDLKRDLAKAESFSGYSPAWKTRTSVEKAMKIIFS